MNRNDVSAVELQALKAVARGQHVPQSVLEELAHAGLIRTHKEKGKLVPTYATPKAIQILLEAQE